jgi:cytosine/uracil/thiamine/allantoin permease
MEEKKRTVWLTFVAVFVVFWSASCLTACGGINRLMRFWPPTGPGVFSVTGSQAAWVIRNGERTALAMNNLTLCHGFQFQGRTDPETKTVSLDKYSVYQHISRQPN